MGCNNCGNTNCTSSSDCGCSVTSYTQCCETTSVSPESVTQISHGDIIVKEARGPVLTADRSFSIPDCNEETKISVLGEVQTPPEGTIAYVAKGSKKAYLTVIGVNRFYTQDACGQTCAVRSELTVINECLSCTTLTAGTFLDENTPVMLDAPDCVTGAGGSSDLVLCDKLHVPEVGETETVEVDPSTSGLSIGDVVQITDKKFEVFSIPSSLLVELLNSGEGGDPGTVIDGSDCSTVRIFKVSSENPCAKTPVLEADLVRVCDGSSDTVLSLQDGQVVGQVNGKIVGVNVVTEDTAVVGFSNCVTLNPAISPQEYAVILDDPDDTDLFPEGSIVYFDCDTVSPARRFTVDTQGATTLVLTPNFTVTGIDTIGDCDNCNLVLAGCCERIDQEIEDLVCRLDYLLPRFDQGEVGRCHEQGGSSGQTEIKLTYQIGESTKHFTGFTSKALDDNSDYEIEFTNTKDCEVRLVLTARVVEFHNNIVLTAIGGGSPVSSNAVVTSRYVWNLIDSSPGAGDVVLDMGGFMFAKGGNTGDLDFPESDSADFASAGPLTTIKVGNVVLRHVKNMAAGESIRYTIRELFSYVRDDTAAAKELYDNMCYVIKWDLEAHAVDPECCEE